MLLSEAIAKSKDELKQKFKNSVFTRMKTDQELFHYFSILYRFQTEHEQNSASTISKNKKGLSTYDAPIATELYKSYWDKHFFEEAEKIKVKHLLSKYARQFIDFWIERGTIKRIKGGWYYESRDERLKRIGSLTITDKNKPIQTDLFD